MYGIRCKYDDPNASYKIAEAIRSHWIYLRRTITCLKPVIVCVGSDYYTGDALGPLVGSALAQNITQIPVYGTMEYPLHAGNLAAEFDRILGKHPDGFFLMIDSAVSDKAPAGTIVAHPGPLTPGAGLGKSLPSFGEFTVVGIVGMPVTKHHPMLGEYVTTPEIRLHTVLQMASVIKRSVMVAFDQEAAYHA